MNWLSVRQAVVQEFLRLDGASTTLADDLIDRAICQALADLRPLALWFNTDDLALDTVVDQQNYTRRDYAGSSVNKLPWGFWRPVGEKLLLDHEKAGNITPYDLDERHPEQWDRADRLNSISSRPSLWTLKGRELYVTPAPDSVDQIFGRYVVDLGTPMPQYYNSAWRYVIQEKDGSPVIMVHEAQTETGGTFADVTTNVNLATAASDITLGSAANDAFYFGFDWFPLSPLNITIGVQGVGSYAVTWQFWDGSAWTSLAGVTDNTNSFKSAPGAYTLVYTLPTTAQKRTVEDGTVRRYWIRALNDGAGASVDPTVRNVTTSVGIDPNTFSTAWFTEPAAFDVLVCRAALQFFARYQRDNEQRERANAALIGAMSTLRATQGSIATMGELEPWMGDSQASFEYYYSDD